ncbi:hypothetical protein [Parafrankia sp. BMG5.11]|uniref:hypothetical protein n=1 Tax=Parafrankia sp. BMG5.11 TaxID=222540 RepID=UPI00103C2858|nr:hypothetical protein [Parafrankia sp. BMG5.11]TCJ40221.1 hypothetical protein E0504_06130 [Parafrankia sp. BMG5.11]
MMLPSVLRAQGGLVVTPEDFGARSNLPAVGAIQAALDHLARRGGGTLRISGTYRGGIVVVRGSNIVIDGAGGTLRDTRLVVAQEASNISVRDLTLLETRAQADSYLLDVAGSDCRFINLSMIKEPMAGGYQGYLRAPSRGCQFDGLKVRGSNGIFVAGRNHVFQNFDMASTLRPDIGGDDAFALKGAGSITDNIVLRRGTVRGFSAAVSIGSEVGSSREHPGAGIVRRVTVEDVIADRCQMVCFIKPGALIYDWRGGVVEDVWLTNIRLTDPGGIMFMRGIVINAGRGAQVRRITASGITIAARAHAQDVMQTSAAEILIRDQGAPSLIEDVSLQFSYDGAGPSGYPVDHIVRIEKDNPAVGTMRRISIDVTGAEARISGIHVGAGLDDAVVILRADLDRVALSPPSSLGAAGIWADSRILAGDVRIRPVRGPQRGGRAR